MSSIRDDEIPSSTGIPSAARRVSASSHRGKLSDLEVTEELLHALPKTDLHCHLDGSMRLKTILELADQQKVRLPADDEEALARAIHQGERCKSLEDYLVAFDVTLSVLQTEDALYRAAYELAIDAANENVRYLEVRYSPALHEQKGLKMTTVIDAVLEGLRVAKRETGIKYGVIVCGIRHINPQSSVRLAELSVAYKNRGVIGFDLAGAEVNFTAHAGEAYGPESIAQAIHYLGAHRIGHGTRLREDGDLLNYVNDHRIPLEVCLSSNVQTGAVPSLSSHPLKFYFDYGLRVTINTDNRLITDTTVTKELWLAHSQLGMGLEDLTTLIVSGFKSAFLSFREKQDMLNQVNDEIRRTLEQFHRKIAAVPA